MNNKRTNNIKELRQKLLLPQDVYKQYQRKLSNTICKDDKKESDKIKLTEKSKKDNINKSISLLDKMVTPLTETNPQYPPKFMEIYRNSLRENGENENSNQQNNNNNSTPTNQDSIKEYDKLKKDIN